MTEFASAHEFKIDEQTQALLDGVNDVIGSYGTGDDNTVRVEQEDWIGIQSKARIDQEVLGDVPVFEFSTTTHSDLPKGDGDVNFEIAQVILPNEFSEAEGPTARMYVISIDEAHTKDKKAVVVAARLFVYGYESYEAYKTRKLTSEENVPEIEWLTEQYEAVDDTASEKPSLEIYLDHAIKQSFIDDNQDDFDGEDYEYLDPQQKKALIEEIATYIKK